MSIAKERGNEGTKERNERSEGTRERRNGTSVAKKRSERREGDSGMSLRSIPSS